MYSDLFSKEEAEGPVHAEKSDGKEYKSGEGKKFGQKFNLMGNQEMAATLNCIKQLSCCKTQKY